MKKTLALFLALTLSFGLLAGCGGTASAPESSTPVSVSVQEPEAAPESPKETSAPEEPASLAEEPLSAEEPEAFEIAETADLPISEAPFSFTMWAQAPPGGLNVVGSPIMEHITAKTNVTVELLEQSMDITNEKFNLMIASQDYPDAISGFEEAYVGGSVKAFEDDVIVDLTDLLAENAPNYMAYIQSDAQNYKDAFNDDGQMLVMHGFNDEYVQARGNVIRKDLLDKLGLEIPETYEEYHDVLMASKDDGVTYPIWMPPTIQSGAWLASGMGISGYNMSTGTHFFQKDGTVYSSFLTQEYKEFLQMMNQWYAEGLFAKDFYAISDYFGQTSEAEILNGNVGLWNHMADKIGTFTKNAAVKGFQAVGLADAVREKGDISHFYQSEGSSKSTNRNIAISVDAQDPATILRFFDYFYTKEGSDMANYGVEGTSFNYDDGRVPHYTELLTDNPEGYTFQQVALLYCWVDIPTIVDRDRSFASTYSQESIDAIALYCSATDGAYEMPSRISFTTEESEEYASLIGDIETRADEMLLRFIIGEYNFQEDWDAFIDDITGMGLERCVELKQNALDRYYQR